MTVYIIHFPGCCSLETREPYSVMSAFGAVPIVWDGLLGRDVQIEREEATERLDAGCRVAFRVKDKDGYNQTIFVTRANT